MASDAIPVRLDRVRLSTGKVLERNEPLILHVSRSDVEDGCYGADIPGLDIAVSGFSSDEIQGAASDLIGVLWQEYALEDDASLTKKARALKARLLRDFTVGE